MVSYFIIFLDFIYLDTSSYYGKCTTSTPVYLKHNITSVYFYKKQNNNNIYTFKAINQAFACSVGSCSVGFQADPWHEVFPSRQRYAPLGYVGRGSRHHVNAVNDWTHRQAQSATCRRK